MGAIEAEGSQQPIVGTRAPLRLEDLPRCRCPRCTARQPLPRKKVGRPDNPTGVVSDESQEMVESLAGKLESSEAPERKARADSGLPVLQLPRAEKPRATGQSYAWCPSLEEPLHGGPPIDPVEAATITAGTAVHLVSSAVPGEEKICAALTAEDVPTCTPFQGVSPEATTNRVCSRSAHKNVVSDTAHKCVIAAQAPDRVVSAATADNVLAGRSDEDIVSGCARDRAAGWKSKNLLAVRCDDVRRVGRDGVSPSAAGDLVGDTNPGSGLCHCHRPRRSCRCRRRR